ncbi:MAG: cyclohexadienyl dehydrogenase [Candidatus Marinimicrobia bacterium]|nr:cyclohexadienyl dehydrogenase [Candidatus Neomarinimicrobiota bacterium]RPG04838.1 MAG: prephenate dehydrogenase/arogenate dehydrogenase family protein [Pelagibacteraceae bacterium TMED247]|tara:strand:- start:3482 stop:4381 length:900 start_codon:yes stop_codon:yes gene_type:complete
MFEQVSIIGCGLIGSSIFKALKKKGSVKKVITFDNDQSVNEIIKKENLSDKIVSSSEEAVGNADLVLISTPLSSFESAVDSIKKYLKSGSILTDTNSVKKGADAIIKKMNLQNISWIPSHPVAGTEKSGPRAGSPDLFKDRWTIITPDSKINDSDVKKLSFFWESIGSKVKIMSAENHDKILSLTSHLPHVIAYNIVKTAMGDDEKMKNDIIRYSAGGLRDFTRIAASSPIMWKDIFIDNSDLIIDGINKFSKSLDEFKKAITEKDSKKLLEIFEKSKEFREAIIKAGQDTDKPGFGRK